LCLVLYLQLCCVELRYVVPCCPVVLSGQPWCRELPVTVDPATGAYTIHAVEEPGSSIAGWMHIVDSGEVAVPAGASEDAAASTAD
jgi:hypothetical protein